MTATLAPPTAAPEQPARQHGNRWELPALAALLLGTGIAYLCNLSANGWANSFYSAAVQAGSVSWKAFFFGSSDAANSITVDKPPASLWLMELSVRAFGLNSWSILVPEVLLGVASVALVWATVRRPFGPAAGLLAGLVLAVTPVAALMFRFNNPDALLVFLMVAAAWAITRAVEDGRWRWLVLTGVFVGFGFLTKQLQVLLVVPPLVLTYLIAGPPKLGKRVLQLLAAGAAMVVAAGWWLLAVELWPAASRPWIGGSQNNSILELTLGYNGLGRLNGNERGSVGMGGADLPAGGGGMWGSPGITRMFEPAQGGQIAWLIPAALVALVAGILLRGKAARTDRQRAGLILWGGWLLATGLTFSFMAGIFHQYYTVALAPAVAALAGAGAVLLWRERRRLWVRLMLALAVGLTTATAWMLLSRSVHWQPWLRWTVLVAGILATLVALVPARRKLAVVSALTIAFTGLAGPTAYAVDTIATAHEGSIPSAGPNVGRFGMFGPGPWGEGMPGGRMPRGDGGQGPGHQGMPGGPAAGQGREMLGGPAGGLLGASKPSDKVVALLAQDGSTYTWAAAAIGSNSAAGFQLATELPVMPIGGFNGSDPSPTLDQFKQYVAEGKIHYFIGSNRGEREGGPGDGGQSTSNQITQWVKDNYTATEVDGVTLYDLTATR
ncbi:putative glycosyltransferase [Nocardia brasiliensis NBRC 14402]|uniref:glycosyltransferase family 39 protein n=1 Tax=Nocardia brasiliensis TaxID=37326 RepID=UPI0002F4E92F|nr:glycosyltransferase family 39 protein [Nocardia brasiliensis]ASF11157.1 glycosyl transferase [Nocardia brasiliensis]GAJ84245.1 putative glycosyltransferase [Nocardia brasiliensis NBRC 14402]SUB10141.1 Predicted membrane protein [Nocardia brasiliensis]